MMKDRPGDGGTGGRENRTCGGYLTSPRRPFSASPRHYFHPSSFLLHPCLWLSDAEAEAESAPAAAEAAGAQAAAPAGPTRHHRDERLDVRDELYGRDARRVCADRARDADHLARLQRA